MKRMRRIICYVLVVVMLVSNPLMGIQKVYSKSKKKYPSRSDNLYAYNSIDSKDTIKIGNKIYYTLNDTFWCFDVKSKKRNSILTIPGGADKLYYSNKSFYIVNSYENQKNGSSEYVEYVFDVYKIDTNNKSYEVFLDDIDIFVGYVAEKYWYVENGELKSTIHSQAESIEYDTQNIISADLMENRIYFVESDKSKNILKKYKYYYIDILTGKIKNIKEKNYNKNVGPIPSGFTYPEKGVNNWRCASYLTKNLATKYAYEEINYATEYLTWDIYSFFWDNDKKSKIFKNPKNKYSVVLCAFDKYLVISVSTNKSAEYFLTNKHGKIIGKLGKEKIK